MAFADPVTRSAAPGPAAWDAPAAREPSESCALRCERAEYREALPVAIAGPYPVVGVSHSDGILVDDASGERFVLKPGFVFLMPQGHTLRLRCLTSVRFALLYLDAQYLQEVARRDFGLNVDGFDLPCVRRESDVVLLTIAQAMCREAASEAAGKRIYADSLAGILAVHLLRDYVQRAVERCTKTSVPPAVSRAVAFIQANYTQDIGLKDIAAAAHVSPYHLTRLFKRAIGYAPYQYLIHARVTGARVLLSAGRRRSLADIAAAVGFVDQSHLTRHFKKAFGMTPGQAA
jgi:AraC family transcriptional regulator